MPTTDHETVTLWLYSNAGDELWVVSHDRRSADGTVLKTGWLLNPTDYGTAKGFAMRVGRERRLPVVQVTQDQAGNEEVIQTA